MKPIAALTTMEYKHGVYISGNQCRIGEVMKGFIVASINQKAIRQSVGLESQVIRYTPGLAQSQEDVVVQYQKAFSDYVVIMTMPIDVLKSNIEALDSIMKQANKENVKGFIIASINQKAVRQSIGLESQVIRYTPCLAVSQEEVVEQYQKAFSDYMVIMTMPVDGLKDNIKALEEIMMQKELENE